MVERCEWGESSPAMMQYHDESWGVPLHDDQALFAKLILDMNQAGLSWATILKKSDNFYRAYEGLVIERVAAFDEEKYQALLTDSGIIRNRLKIRAAIVNAQKVQQIQVEFGSFDQYIWSFTAGQVVQHHIANIADVPASNALSDEISKDMKKRGMKFIGSTTIYAYLQAIGVINDHLQTCFRYRELV